MLRQWTENLMRQKINEETRKLRNWTTLEFKNVRQLFEIPGVIEKASEAAEDNASPNKKHTEQGEFIYKDFKEFVHAQVRLDEENQAQHKLLTE